jgi:hypothetical protein
MTMHLPGMRPLRPHKLFDDIPERQGSHDHGQVSSLVRVLARLGCTRIGSPGIFGERDPKALFTGAKPQVVQERKWVSYRASSPASGAAPSKPRSGHGDHRSRYPCRGYRGTSDGTSCSTLGGEPGLRPRGEAVRVTSDALSVRSGGVCPRNSVRGADLLRLGLVQPARTAVPVFDGWHLPPRLCRPQRKAGEVGLASVPRSP